jgi:hypothetical protein
MAGPIYKMFYMRMKDPWFQLSKAEQDALLAKLGDAMKSVGGKPVVMCESAWNSEKWWYWGVEEYPSIEAVQEHTRCLADLEWFRYCESETLLGTAYPMEAP